MDKELTKPALDAIIKSTTFAKSEVSKQLLIYLYNATIDGKDLKEFTIASELFKKETDIGVRSYIHNLRKKLEEYYVNEGKESTIRFSIPKGQYFIEFQHWQASKASQKLILPKVKVLVTLLIILAIGISLAILYVCFSAKDLSKSHVWSGFLDSKDKRLIVVGDYFFFGGYLQNGRNGVLRDVTVNDEPDFEKYKKTHNLRGDSAEKLNYSYTTKLGIQDMFELMPHFKNREQLSICFSSELTFEDIKSQNIIFVGNYKTIGSLAALVYKKYYEFDSEANTLNFITKDTVIKRKPDIGTINKEDYPTVIKLVTPYKKKLIMFLSCDDPGGLATLDYFLNPENVAAFEKKLNLKDDDSFQAFFKTEGYGRTDFSIEIIAAAKISGVYNK